MGHRTWKSGGGVLLCLVLILIMSACRPEPEIITETVEVTREVVEEVPVTREVEVTRIVPADPVDRVIDEIAAGEPQRGSVDEAGELTGWSFAGEEGARYGFEIRTVSGSLRPVATVYDADDHFIAVSQPLTGRDVLVLAELPADGDYLLVVTGLSDSTGIYEVEHITVSGAAGPIVYDEEVVDILLMGETRTWTLAAEAGELINVQLDSDDFAGQLTIEDPAGEVLNEGSAGMENLFGELLADMMPEEATTEVNGLLLREEGEYAIVVSGVEAGETGRYTLEVELEDTIDPEALGGGELVPGETGRGYLTGSDVDEWTFSGEAGQLVSIAVRGSLDSVLELYDAGGDLIASDDDSGIGMNAQLGSVPLPETGEYTAAVSLFGFGDGSGGAYTIELSFVGSIDLSTVEGGVLEYGQTVDSFLLDAAGAEWTFSGTAGDVVTIVMSSDGLDSYLELRGPDGALLAEDDDSGGGLDAMISAFTLPVSGEYTILARTFADFGAVSGMYELGLMKIP